MFRGQRTEDIRLPGSRKWDLSVTRPFLVTQQVIFSLDVPHIKPCYWPGALHAAGYRNEFQYIHLSKRCFGHYWIGDLIDPGALPKWHENKGIGCSL